MEKKKIPEAKATAHKAATVAAQWEKGILGVELDRFKRNRAIRMQKVIESIARFHIHGNAEAVNVWEGNGSARVLRKVLMILFLIIYGQS